MADIDVIDLTKSFGAFQAVKGSTFTVNDGEFFCLLGPSGCGKTTTLRMIAGLELPSSGTIKLGGADVSRKRASERDIAMVFQMFALYPHMTVRQNISYPLRNVGTPKAETRQRVEEAARVLQITHLLDKPVSGLAGGDRQRVALGRAIVRKPLAFMMDEPLGALDSEFRHVMCGELRALHDRIKATTVYVTHDQVEAMSMADKIAVMSNGVIEQLASPQEIYDFPASLFVADFIGSPSMNLYSFKGAMAKGSRAIRLENGPQEVPELRQDCPHGDYVLGVRPEDVMLADDGPVRGEIFGAEYLGTYQIAIIKTESGKTMRARVSSSVPLKTGERVSLGFKGARLSLFDKASGKALPTARHDNRNAAGGAAHG
jgi:multiple sugar transport system ATP-binding protein